MIRLLVVMTVVTCLLILVLPQPRGWWQVLARVVLCAGLGYIFSAALAGYVR